VSKVVVIDDEPFILMLVEDRLRRAGLQVVALRESVGAMQRIRREKPDLIILDWMMPELSGLELLRALKADPALSSIPVFMLTAKGRKEDEEKGLASGAARFISKPFSPKALLGAVLQQLGLGDGH
jgi:CheY-like chemotaxis protein